MTTLALLGGDPIRDHLFPPHSTLDDDDIAAAVRVLKRGRLSEFEGSHNQWFMGGQEIRAAEEAWQSYFRIKHAISFNSATSGLYAAVGAAQVSPGDEVITSPWTMTATATAALVYQAVPIFADIDPETFCLLPEDVERRITERTRAIIPVHIYGHPADMDPLMRIAEKYNLLVIEDAAQSPGAAYKGRVTGSIGHMGVQSLNCNKIIQTGEGGYVFTNDDDLALRLQLIRNHGEAVIASGMPVQDLVNMVGWNYRMTEIEAAISMTQLEKLPGLQKQRLALASHMNTHIREFHGLLPPVIQPDCEHTYYRYAIRVEPGALPIRTSTLVNALNAEGFDWYAGYKPLNTYPIYQEKMAFGRQGYPFNAPFYNGDPDYSMDSFPNVRHHLQYSFSTEDVRPPLTFEDMDSMLQAFRKVYENLDALAEYEREQPNASN